MVVQWRRKFKHVFPLSYAQLFTSGWWNRFQSSFNLLRVPMGAFIHGSGIKSSVNVAYLIQRERTYSDHNANGAAAKSTRCSAETDSLASTSPPQSVYGIFVVFLEHFHFVPALPVYTWYTPLRISSATFLKGTSLWTMPSSHTWILFLLHALSNNTILPSARILCNLFNVLNLLELGPNLLQKWVELGYLNWFQPSLRAYIEGEVGQTRVQPTLEGSMWKGSHLVAYSQETICKVACLCPKLLRV